MHELTPSNHNAYVWFTTLAAVKDKIVANLQVLENLKAGEKIRSYGEQQLYPDDRYLADYRGIQLDTKDIHWTFQNILVLLEAKGMASSIDEKNRDLIKIAGSVEATIRIYFKSLHRLKKTYRPLSPEISDSIKKIKVEFKHSIYLQIQQNNTKSYNEMQQIIKPTIPEIPSEEPYSDNEA